MFSIPASCLNDGDIEELASRGAIEREEGDLHIGPSSLDLHVAAEQVEIQGCSNNPNINPTAIDINDENTYPQEFRIRDADPLTIAPGEFCLARSQEVLYLPHNVMGYIDGRSSVGRLGLFVENAGLVDRGFSGTLTLELYNPTDNLIKVPAESRIAQVAFFVQGGERDTAYDGKYQGQYNATTSRLYEDGYENDGTS